jgi:hypothetical protein
MALAAAALHCIRTLHIPTFPATPLSFLGAGKNMAGAFLHNGFTVNSMELDSFI